MASHMVCPCSSEFLGVCERTVECYIFKFLVSSDVKLEPVGHSYRSISFAQCKELIVFAHQIWKPQFLSVMQSLFNNCHFLSRKVFWNECISTFVFQDDELDYASFTFEQFYQLYLKVCARLEIEHLCTKWWELNSYSLFQILISSSLYNLVFDLQASCR